MTVPSTINTVQGVVTVNIVSGLEKEKKAHGLWEWNKQTISLDDSLVLTAQRQCLMHELLHTIEDTSGQLLTEKEIDGYAVHLIYLLQHNPQLVEFLTGEKIWKKNYN